jgi:hypothetical protein
MTNFRLIPIALLCLALQSCQSQPPEQPRSTVQPEGTARQPKQDLDATVESSRDTSATTPSATNDQQLNLPEWKSNIDFKTRLVKPAAANPPFQIKVPKDFALSANSQQYTETYFWKKPYREDRTAPAFMVSIFRRHPSQKTAMSLDEALQTMVKALGRGRKENKAGEGEKGTINGLLFARAYTEGFDREAQKPVKGFCYVAKVGDDIVAISGSDFPPNEAQNLRELESCTHSFQLLAQK